MHKRGGRQPYEDLDYELMSYEKLEEIEIVLKDILKVLKKKKEIE